MEPISLDFVLEAVGGVCSGPRPEREWISVCTDTRKIAPGCLFLALRGERFDGNDFLKEAFAKGASACIAERDCEDGPVIRVADTRTALHALAAAYRGRFSIPVVGITGSVGKTSTKEMIASVLSQRFITHKNEGNLNNEIGMPLSVFGLSKEHQAAVFEMGMSGFGEISRLTRIARPDIGVMTNIGVSHMEKLGSQENILKAKLELLEGLKPGGHLILNGDDRLLREVCLEGFTLLTYGIENASCDFRADHLEIGATETAFDLHFEGKTVRARLPVCGKHHVYNALAAFACGRLLGVTPEEALDGFQAFAPAGMRQLVEEFNGITLIKDCYNASPDSMHAAFEVLRTLPVRNRRIAVLGDMLELGSAAPQAHRQVGAEAFENGVDLLLAFGENARHYCLGYEEKANGSGRECRFFTDREALAAAVAGAMHAGDAVLFKASRGMRLEDTIEKACERWKNE